ncbi:hypothetical protein [Clostridium sp. DL-VIII]|nr:hypothetical protein [Clostridium sp. DL-VIII]
MNEVRVSEDNFEPRDFVPLSIDGVDWMTKEVVPAIIFFKIIILNARLM